VQQRMMEAEIEEKKTILAVDDDQMNLEIITNITTKAGYHVLTASNGREALKLFEQKQEKIKAIVLDWMMPEMDGIQVLKLIKKHPNRQNIPVIMQTAKNNKEDIVKGINEGAYYYLTKPFEEEVLLSILRAAVSDFERYEDLSTQLQIGERIPGLMNEGCFQFQTLHEGKQLAQWLARACPSSINMALGLNELFSNAVEHGNLGISYEEKTELNNSNTLEPEIHHRLQLPENLKKQVKVTFEKNSEKIRIRIKDQGKGFEFSKYLAVSTERLSDNHGRGIVMTKNVLPE